MASSNPSSSSSSGTSSRSLRSKAELTELTEIYPMCKYKLPTYKEVIGVVRHENQSSPFQKAISDVSTTLFNHWISRNVYPYTVVGIKKKLAKEVDEFRYITKTAPSKRGKTWQSRYQAFSNKANKLFDVFCENKEQREKLEEEYHATGGL